MAYFSPAAFHRLADERAASSKAAKPVRPPPVPRAPPAPRTRRCSIDEEDEDDGARVMLMSLSRSVRSASPPLLPPPPGSAAPRSAQARGGTSGGVKTNGAKMRSVGRKSTGPRTMLRAAAPPQRSAAAAAAPATAVPNEVDAKQGKEKEGTRGASAGARTATRTRSNATPRRSRQVALSAVDDANAVGTKTLTKKKAKPKGTRKTTTGKDKLTVTLRAAEVSSTREEIAVADDSTNTTVAADLDGVQIQNGARVVFPKRAWQKSEEPVDGKHFYYDTEASKSQWLEPALSKLPAKQRPTAAVVLSPAYVAYVDKVAQNDAHSTLVVDCTYTYGAPAAVQRQHQAQQHGKVQPKPQRRVLLEQVPLTEIEVVANTPPTSLPDCRIHVHAATTTPEMLRRAFLSYSDRPFLGQEVNQGNKQFEWITYGETYQQAASVVKALLSLGVQRGSFVGMCAHNSVAHVQTMLALMMGGFVAVPLSLHLSEDHARHIVQEARLRAVFVSPATAPRYRGFAAALPSNKTFHVLECLDGPEQVLAAWAVSNTNPIIDQVTALPSKDSTQHSTTIDGNDYADGGGGGSCSSTSSPSTETSTETTTTTATTTDGVQQPSPTFYSGAALGSIETPSFFHSLEGLIECPSLWDGNAWMQVQITTEPKPISKLQQIIRRIASSGRTPLSFASSSSTSASTLSSIGPSLWSAYGRWQLNGGIEEVKVTWHKAHVTVTNNASNIKTGSRAKTVECIQVVLPLADFERGEACSGTVWSTAALHQTAIGVCNLAPISIEAKDAGHDDNSGGSGGSGDRVIIGWKCPVGHRLTPSTTIPQDRRVCDVCNTLIPDCAAIHACNSGHDDASCPVGYDVCAACYSSAKLCPQGHLAAKFVVGKHVSAVCDICSADLLRGAEAFGCIACDFDVCSSCAVAHPEGPQTAVTHPLHHATTSTSAATTVGVGGGVGRDSQTTLENKRSGSNPVLILYTSGSTGAPKGAVVSAAAFFAEVHPFISINKDYDESSVGLVDSPLSVSATPYNLCYPMLNGGRVAVYATLTRVFEVAKVISPDSLGLVPQLWAALYKQYQAKIAVEVAKAVAQKEKEYANANGGSGSASKKKAKGPPPKISPRKKTIMGKQTSTAPVLERNNSSPSKKGPPPALRKKSINVSSAVVMDLEPAVITSAIKVEIQAAATTAVDQEFRLSLGFRCRALNCGGATPMPHVQAWLKRVFPQCFVTENYASTEAGPITNTMDGDTVDGAGRIQEGITIKLEDYGEYKSTDTPYPRGEILVKTAAGAVGYLNRPDLTAAAWDADGFYHTGDIGAMPSPTHIKIIDRKKNIFKLVNGEWISPENVEAAYTGLCPSIAQIFVHGDSRHSHIVAVVVTTSDAATAKHLDEKVILEELKAAATQSGMRHFEVPLAIKVIIANDDDGINDDGEQKGDDTHQGFTVGNGGLTQTCKLCRPKLRTRFKEVLHALYLATADIDAREDDGRGQTLVELLRKALAYKDGGGGGHMLTRKDDAQWAELDWDSIRTLLAVNLIKVHFHVDVSVDELLSITADGGGNVRDVAALVLRAQSGEVQGTLSKEVTAAVLAQECKLPLADVEMMVNMNTAATLPSSPSSPQSLGDVGDNSFTTTTSTPTPSTVIAAATATATTTATPRPTYFLTGATGFLGAGILRYLAELHEHEEWSCCCLVRPGKRDDGDDTDADSIAFDRLEASLYQRKQMSPALAAQLLPRPNGASASTSIKKCPITVVGGTLGEPMFGLTQPQFMQLGADLAGGTILHCASHVSHIASYWSLKRANVDAITDLINLSVAGSNCTTASTGCSSSAAAANATATEGSSDAGTAALKKTPGLIHYISTISVVDGNDADESYVGSPEFMLQVGGYAQSKWVGEMRLREAAAAGFIRLGIVRPGLLTPDTRTGSSNLTDWLVRFISGTLLIGGYRVAAGSSSNGSSNGSSSEAVHAVVPAATHEESSLAHVTPVDHAAEYVCRLLSIANVQTSTKDTCAGTAGTASTAGGAASGNVGSSGSVDDAGAQPVAVFHLPLSIVMPTSILMDKVATTSAYILDRKVRVLSEEQWANALDHLPDNNPLLPFRDMFRDGLGGISPHCHTHTTAALLGDLQGPINAPRAYTEEEVALLVDYISADSVVSEPAVVARTASGLVDFGEDDAMKMC